MTAGQASGTMLMTLVVTSLVNVTEWCSRNACSERAFPGTQQLGWQPFRVWSRSEQRKVGPYDKANMSSLSLIGRISCWSSRPRPNPADLGETTGYKKQLFCPRCGTLTFCLLTQHKAKAKQQIKLISVKFLQEFLCFDSVCLYLASLGWSQKQRQDFGRRNVSQHFFLIYRDSTLPPALWRLRWEGYLFAFWNGVSL